MRDIKDIMVNTNAQIQPVMDKVERLVSAVYLVTGFISDKEPLKWRIRTLSTDMLRTSCTLKQSHAYATEKFYKLAELKDSTISFLRVAKNAGLISSMNADVIEKEFGTLENLMNQSPAPEFPVAERVIEREKVAQLPPRKVEETAVLRDKSEPRRPLLDEVSYKTSNEQVHQPVSEKKNVRQSVILDLVAKRGEIMIKDVTPLIEGCSEKTIQRELLAMVSGGVLKKVGEKRWSKYSLA